jgi:hypothetical protein
MVNTLNRAVGSKLAAFLSKSLSGYRRLDTVSTDQVADVLERGDIILVEGNTRISSAIKYLTQSSWSHATLFVGSKGESASTLNLLEADLQNGVRLVGVDHYEGFNLRICRPVNLAEADKDRLVSFAKDKLGHKYDLRNVLDLTRYLIQKPAVPTRYRRSMIGFGSGEPTKAICSTLIAETFQSINYPILPLRGQNDSIDNKSGPSKEDLSTAVLVKDAKGEVPLYYKRHFTHFTPRDFDLSPYFEIIKPTIEHGFDHHVLHFKEDSDA